MDTDAATSASALAGSFHRFSSPQGTVPRTAAVKVWHVVHSTRSRPGPLLRTSAGQSSRYIQVHILYIKTQVTTYTSIRNLMAVPQHEQLLSTSCGRAPAGTAGFLLLQ